MVHDRLAALVTFLTPDSTQNLRDEGKSVRRVIGATKGRFRPGRRRSRS
jgi:hypothetical protein